MTTLQTDVVVVGGGPAGSTVSTLLAQHGCRVTLFERDRYPRFHIGESLLPMNLPIFERLGVLDKVRAMGVFKPGADFEAARCSWKKLRSRVRHSSRRTPEVMAHIEEITAPLAR